jgi:hypothetical protein
LLRKQLQQAQQWESMLGVPLHSSSSSSSSSSTGTPQARVHGRLMSCSSCWQRQQCQQVPQRLVLSLLLLRQQRLLLVLLLTKAASLQLLRVALLCWTRAWLASV